jgi:hypothetical protein
LVVLDGDTTPRLNLINAINYAQSNKELLTNEYLGELMDSGNIQGIIDTLQMIDTSELGTSRLIDYYLLDHQFTKAKNTISKFTPTNADLQEELILQTIKANLEYRGYDSLSNEELEEVGKLAEEYSYAGVKARNILKFLGLADFEELIEVPSSYVSKRRAFDEQVKTYLVLDKEFGIYPNPANNNITVTYSLVGAEGAELIFFDVLGNVSYQIQLAPNTSNINLSTISWMPGIHFVQLNAPDQITHTAKFMLIHE